MEVVIEDIVSGFTNTLRGFSQAELILDRLENIVWSELRSCGTNVLRFVESLG